LEKPNLNYSALEAEINRIGEILRDLIRTPGSTRCGAKINENYDPRIDSEKEKRIISISASPNAMIKIYRVKLFLFFGILPLIFQIIV